MRIWMEEQVGEKDHFAAGITLSVIGLAVAAIALPCGVTLMALILGGPVAEVSLAACIGGAALTVFLARKIGRKVHQYCTVFCQDDEGRLFAVDIRKFVGCQRGAIGFVQMLFQMQKAKKNMKTSHILERYMRQRPSLTGVETQILSVEKMRMAGNGWRVICQVEYPNKKRGKRSFLLVGGYENEGELVAAFERRLKGTVM
ncbi:hypothetical protein INF30_08630 [Lachnospiraceae bacterium DSM 108991]|uniref:Uncharacterized protein n=1 Tax=Claveliimonas monacensis TaxID=2779351 RepID=A0ABR9RK37_9FIRM|nr:hypothetical protein [Claveliimonas monacensis]MBE5063327.1 hypothetical protein [Claveliimonas monacensis]